MADPAPEHTITQWDQGTRTEVPTRLIGEEPLSIRLQGNPYSVVMRTPGEEIPHVAGFCLGEGIVDRPEEITAIAFCDGSDTNVVTVTLKPERADRITGHLERRNFVSQTSCGLCGKEMVEELFQLIRPVADEVRLPAGEALARLEGLADLQPLRRLTRAVHAAALFDADLRLLSAAEDVGRHNALDKAVGKLFLEDRLGKAKLLVLSSRISYELVQKAARARIPVILAVSRPTALAVDLASGLDMTLACLARGAGLFIFCGGKRLGDGPAAPQGRT